MEIINASLELTYIEINDDAFNNEEDPSEITYISSSTFKHTSASLPATSSGETTFLLPFRCASLKALYCAPRPFATAIQGANATAAYRKGSRSNPYFLQIYLRVGSSMIPNKPIQ